MANEVEAPAPGTPEYDAAMAAKAKEGGVTTVDHDNPPAEGAANEKPVRPEHIPEKFWDAEKGAVNVEALAKSYTELEKVRSKSATEPTAEEKAAAEKAAADAKAAGGDAGGEALRAKAEQEWRANGTLSEETFAAYEKAGVTRAQIDTYIEGQEALARERESEAYAVVGGEESYKAMQAWANANLTQPEKDAYDRDVFGKDKAVRANAIRGLAARYAQSEGSDGKMVVPNSDGGKQAGEHFGSKAEMIAAMRDPKYKTSATYRNEVAQKIANAAKAGVYLGVS